MRIIGQIPSPHCKISVFHMNDKYIVKVEKAHLEQSFKVPEEALMNGQEDLKQLFNEEMVIRIMERFRDMAGDLQSRLAQL